MGSKFNNIHWDTVNLEYPVKKFPLTEGTSTKIGHEWRGTPEVLLTLKEPKDLKEFEYSRDSRIEQDLKRSQTKVDFGHKQANIRKINKHTSCTENQYIYPCSRQLEKRPLLRSSHSVTEHQDCFKKNTFPPTLVAEKNQYKHPFNVSDYNKQIINPILHKELPPLDTTYDGFEKYLDPYLSTNRLHHRPYTSDQLKKHIGSRDIITYYTFSNTPWIHTPKPVSDQWQIPHCIPKRSTFDREKFKGDCREIRTHNKQKWLSGSFRTESRDNYKRVEGSVGFHATEIEDDTKGFYKKSVAEFPTKDACEDQAIKGVYVSEYMHMGSGKPMCRSLDQFVKKN